MANAGTQKVQPEVPHLGEAGYFCIELFCGSGNLTYAMKHFFPDSFGVDHKVGKQRVKTICLDLSVDSNQQLVELACGCIGAFHVALHHVLVSGGLAESLMGHLHSEVIGGQMLFHFSKESIWCKSDFRIVCIHSWLVLSQSCIKTTLLGLWKAHGQAFCGRLLTGDAWKNYVHGTASCVTVCLVVHV